MKLRLSLRTFSLVFLLASCAVTMLPANTLAPPASVASATAASSTPPGVTSAAAPGTAAAIRAIEPSVSPALSAPNSGNGALSQRGGRGAASDQTTNQGGSGSVTANDMHVSTSSTIRDVVDHPMFKGFGRFILPLDRGSYDESASLQNVASLLPYHSNIDPSAVVSTINAMIDEAASGRTIFYDVYSDAQKQSDPTKGSTGLFFFRGDPGAPLAVISPGGGFSYVGSVHEGFPYAIALRQKGYNAFVVQYRVGGERIATEDLAAALSYIVRNASTLGVSTDGYSVWGSSAGARMAARIGSYGATAYGGDAIPGPATVVMAYTGHTDFTPSDPPTFPVVGARDGIASPSTMERRVTEMRGAGIDVEFHVYPSVGHGFGLGTGTTAEGWLDAAVRFWEKHLPAPSRTGGIRAAPYP